MSMSKGKKFFRHEVLRNQLSFLQSMEELAMTPGSLDFGFELKASVSRMIQSF